ncbi:MAG: nitrogenase component 1 [Oscillospiraceae bacterium]|nr:nitrogenase component 1 [Oscillospiraceae bacterium]
MSSYLTNISPDSFSGLIFAFEGISRCVVVLNGPTGCKYYHSSVSDTQMIRQTEFDPLKFPEKWYFGQPRVPCSYLDNYDYVFGSSDKLEETLIYIRDHVKFDLLCIVNSPGAALIGDDLVGIAKRIIMDKPVITVETPGFSDDVCKGYERGVLRLINSLSLTRHSNPNPRSVNILGLSLFHKNCTGDIVELKHMMELCGITVNCVLCADCDLEQIKNLPDAALNIVIHPEYALETAKLLYKLCGTQYYVCDGLPIGFSATETLMHEVCNRLGTDISSFTEYCERARARAFSFISRVNSLAGLPRGVTFAMEGTYSELYAYTAFLVRYFGMIPVCASILNAGSDCFKDKLYELYDEFDVRDVLDQDIIETDGTLVFATGNTISALMMRKHSFLGIETALPTLGYVDVIPKTHLGVQGALTIVEQVLSGMMLY